MTRPIKLLIGFLLLVIAITCGAIWTNGQSPKAIKATDKAEPMMTLSTDESKEVETSVAALQAAQNEINAAAQEGRTVKLEAQACVAVIAKLQLGFAHMETAQTKFDVMKDKHRRSHQCEDCEYSPDGKGLVKPKKDAK